MHPNLIDLHRLSAEYTDAQAEGYAPLEKAYALNVKKIIAHDAYEQACHLTAWQQLYDQLHPGTFEGSIFEVWLDGLQFFKETTNLMLRQSCIVWPGAVWFGIPKSKSRESFVSAAKVEEGQIAVRPGGHEFELITPNDLELMGFVMPLEELERLFELTTERSLHGVLSQSATINVDSQKKDYFWRHLNEVLTAIEQNSEKAHHVNAQKFLKESLVMSMIGLLDDAVFTPNKVRYSQTNYRRIINQSKEYILSRPEEAITILELCNHLHVSHRTLQNAFHSVLGICPLRYLKAIRLNAVRRELLSHYSEYKTVQDVAGAWGFWHLSQFSADYHRFFNELPSQTLAKRGEVFQKIILM